MTNRGRGRTTTVGGPGRLSFVIRHSSFVIQTGGLTERTYSGILLVAGHTPSSLLVAPGLLAAVQGLIFCPRSVVPALPVLRTARGCPGHPPGPLRAGWAGRALRPARRNSGRIRARRAHPRRPSGA